MDDDAQKPAVHFQVAVVLDEGIVQNLYYRWSKDFLEAGKKRLAGDTARAATSEEVKDLPREARALKEVVAELTLENRVLKKRMARPVCNRDLKLASARSCANVSGMSAAAAAKMEIHTIRAL